MADKTPAHPNDAQISDALSPSWTARPEQVVMLWERIYRDECDEGMSEKECQRYADIVVRSFDAAIQVFVHMIATGVPASDNCHDFVGVHSSASASIQNSAEAIHALPQLAWWCSPLRHEPVTIDWCQGHLLLLPDVLPDDTCTLSAVFAAARSVRVPSECVTALWLRHEEPTNSVMPVDLLTRAEQILHDCADADLLFRWSALPLRWRYYILRDTSSRGQSVAELIANDDLPREDLLALVARPVEVLCNTFSELMATPDVKSSHGLPVAFLTRIACDCGVLLLPFHEYTRSCLDELRDCSAAMAGNRKDRRLLVRSIIRAIDSCQVAELSHCDSAERMMQLFRLRGAALSHKMGTAGPWFESADVEGVLDSLPLQIRVRDGSGVELYQNRCATAYERQLGQSVPFDRADDWLVATNPSPTPHFSHNLLHTHTGVRHYLMAKQCFRRAANEHPLLIECAVDVSDDVGQRERWEQACNAIGIGLWHRQVDSKEAWYSPAWKAMLGFRDVELANRYETWESLIVNDDKERVVEAMEAYLSGKSDTYDIEYRMRHKSPGRVVWVHARGALVSPYGDEGPRFFTGVHFDITEYKAQGVFQREALDAMEDVFVFVKDRDLRFVYANGALVRALGRDPLNLRDSDLFTDSRSVQFFSETDERVFQTASARVIGGHLRIKTRFAIAEEYFDDQSGKRRWLATVKQPMMLPDGQLHLLGVSVDISELRDVKMYLDALTRTQDLVYVKNREGRFQMVNQAFANTVGLHCEEVQQQTDFTYFPRSYAEQWRAEEQEVLRSGNAIIDSARLVFGRNKRSCIRVVSKVPVVNRDGQVEGVVGIAKDVTKVVSDLDAMWYGVAHLFPLVNRSQWVVFVKDRFGRFLTWNKRFASRHMHVDGGLLGKTDFDCWSWDDAERYRRDDRKVLDGRSVVGPYFEEQHHGKDTPRMLLTVKGPLEGVDGEVMGLVGLYEDVGQYAGDSDSAIQALREELEVECRDICTAWKGIIEGLSAGGW